MGSQHPKSRPVWRNPDLINQARINYVNEPEAMSEALEIVKQDILHHVPSRLANAHLVNELRRAMTSGPVLEQGNYLCFCPDEAFVIWAVRYEQRWYICKMQTEVYNNLMDDFYDQSLEESLVLMTIWLWDNQLQLPELEIYRLEPDEQI